LISTSFGRGVKGLRSQQTVSTTTGRQQWLFDPQRPLGFFRVSPDGAKIAFDASGNIWMLEVK
jgi:hypothetical protein